MRQHTKFCPWNKASRAVCHIERVGGERKTLSRDDAQNCRNATFKSKLNLSLMIVSWSKRHS